MGLTKTGKRLIDLPDHLAAKLERHIKNLRKVVGPRVGYLFPGINARNVQNAMRRVCRLAQKKASHDLRHTFASLLLMDHVSPAFVQRLLGHHSIRTIFMDIGFRVLAGID